MTLMKWILIGISTDSIVIEVIPVRNAIHELLLCKAWQIDGGGLWDVDAVFTGFAPFDSSILGILFGLDLLRLVFC